MNFLQELKNLIKNTLRWTYSLVALSFFFFLFPLNKPFSLLFFDKIKEDLLPQGVELIVTNPMSAFLSQIVISFVLAFMVISPFIIYGIVKYLSPALYEEERKTLFKLIIPFTFLFVGGSIFSYFFIIPPSFKILYSFTKAMGAAPFFAIGEFVYSVLGLMLAVGIMFLLPIFMSILSWVGLIEAGFWKNNWKYAFLVFLIFSAIITPDGTGITMAILAIPLVGLYGVGIVASKKQN